MSDLECGIVGYVLTGDSNEGLYRKGGRKHAADEIMIKSHVPNKGVNIEINNKLVVGWIVKPVRYSNQSTVTSQPAASVATLVNHFSNVGTQRTE